MRINRPDQCLITGGFSAAHQTQRVLARCLLVELKPQRAAAPQLLRCRVCGLRNFFQCVAGEGAYHHARAHGHGCAGRGQLAIGMRQPLVSDGGQQQRPFQ